MGQLPIAARMLRIGRRPIAAATYDAAPDVSAG